MLKIGDFSRLAQVSVRTLRLYDEMGLLKPAQIDRFTDYRYYDLDQLPRLHRILALKDLGLSLDQIRSLLKRDVPLEQLEGMLLMRQTEIERTLHAEQARLQRVAARLQQLRAEGAPSVYEVVIKSADAVWVASRRAVIPTLEDMRGLRCSLYEDLAETLRAHRVTPGQPEMAMYHIEGYVEENIDMSAAMPVEPAAGARVAAALGPVATIRIEKLAAAPMIACVVHRGPMETVTEAITALFRWIGANDLSSAGPLRELHLGFAELEHDFSQPVTVEYHLPVSE